MGVYRAGDFCIGWTTHEAQEDWRECMRRQLGNLTKQQKEAL